jgi:hypothetical protein
MLPACCPRLLSNLQVQKVGEHHSACEAKLAAMAAAEAAFTQASNAADAAATAVDTGLKRCGAPIVRPCAPAAACTPPPPHSPRLRTLRVQEWMLVP